MLTQTYLFDWKGMVENTKRMTRRELYDLVWSKPILKLAEEFNLSDRGLAKICERHRVPVPPRGYWAKLAAGKKVKQIRLYDVDDPFLNRVDIIIRNDDLPSETKSILDKARQDRAARKEQKPRAVKPVEAFPEIDKPHRILASTATKLRKRKPDEWGGCVATEAGHCGVKVHQSRCERAISILDRLIRTLLEKNIGVKATGNAIEVSRDDATISFTLVEKTKREKHEPTEEELDAYEAHRRKNRSRFDDFSFIDFGWNKPWPEYDIIYTGMFSFKIECGPGTLRQSWNDGKTQSIESMFDDIVTGIDASLSAEKARIHERAEAEKRHQHMAQRRELARRRKDREEKRLTILGELIEAQEKADRIRAWLARSNLVVQETSESDLSRMIAWAREHLTHLEEMSAAAAVSERISANELFPEDDPYFDPEGEPPAGYGYYW